MSASSHRRTPGSPEIPQRNFSTIQGDLFGRLAEPSRLHADNGGDLDIGAELMGAVHRALRESRDHGLSRERIADRMNLALPHLKRPISKRQLDAWTAASKEHHELPSRYIAAFCWATGSEEPLRVTARALGFDLVDAREAAALELGEAQVQIARLRRKSGALTKTLGG